MKKIGYLLLATQLLMFCKSDNRKFNFSEFKLVFENEIVHKVNKEGDLFDKESLIAKVYKDKGVITDSEGKILVQVNNNEILDVKGNFLFTVNENGEGRKNGMVYKWSKEGEFIMNEKKTGIMIQPMNPNSCQLASVLLFLHNG